MAKQSSTPKSDDKGKIRVFLFELEGTNETMVESLKTITGALNSTFGGSRKIVRLPANSDTVVNEAEEAEWTDEIDDLVEAETIETNETKTPSRQKRQRSVKTPSIVDIDLQTGSPSLREFIEKKKPSDHSKKYLVIAYWLKEYRNLEEITEAHIYTCYRFLT